MILVNSAPTIYRLHELTGLSRRHLYVLSKRMFDYNRVDWYGAAQILSAFLRKKSRVENDGLVDLSFKLIRTYFESLNFLESRKSGKIPYSQFFESVSLNALVEAMNHLKTLSGRQLWKLMISNMENDYWDMTNQKMPGEKIFILLFLLKYATKTKDVFDQFPILKEEPDNGECSIEWIKLSISLQKNFVLKYLTEIDHNLLNCRVAMVYQDAWTQNHGYPENFYTDTLASLIE